VRSQPCHNPQPRRRPAATNGVCPRRRYGRNGAAMHQLARLRTAASVAFRRQGKHRSSRPLLSHGTQVCMEARWCLVDLRPPLSQRWKASAQLESCCRVLGRAPALRRQEHRCATQFFKAEVAARLGDRPTALSAVFAWIAALLCTGAESARS
jgi:hypothetical protein